MKTKVTDTQPRCRKCGRSGAVVQFAISSPYGFGTYCVECEAIIDATPERGGAKAARDAAKGKP